MIDFAPGYESLLRQKGYNITEGSTGTREGTLSNYNLARVHEYDIIAFDTSGARKKEAGYSGPRIDGSIFFKSVQKGAWLIVFLGERYDEKALVGQRTSCTLIDSTQFPFVQTGGPIAQQFVKIFERHKNIEKAYHIEETIAFISIRGQPLLQQSPTCLLRDELGRQVAAVAAFDKGFALLLPSFSGYPGNVKVLDDLLAQVIPHFSPDLFPGWADFAWLEVREYRFHDENVAEDTLWALEEEHRQKKAQKEADLEREKAKYEAFRDILRLDGDPLKAAIKAILEHLEFPCVVDMDEASPRTAKTGDLWLEDGDYVALCECKGTEGGPAESHFSQLLKNLNRVMRQKKRTDIRGLLVLNYFRKQPALQREGMYASSPATIADAEDQQVGLLSTVELFKMVQAVVDGKLPKEQARDNLKKPGLITYPVGL